MAVGIEKLKQVAKFGIDLGEKLATTLKGGDFKATDIFAFLPILMQVPELINSKDEIAAEFKDLDANERAELNTYIQTEFTLEDAALEGKIEAALDAVVSILVLVDKFKAPASSPEPETPAP